MHCIDAQNTAYQRQMPNAANKYRNQDKTHAVYSSTISTKTQYNAYITRHRQTITSINPHAKHMYFASLIFPTFLFPLERKKQTIYPLAASSRVPLTRPFFFVGDRRHHVVLVFTCLAPRSKIENCMMEMDRVAVVVRLCDNGRIGRMEFRSTPVRG